MKKVRLHQYCCKKEIGKGPWEKRVIPKYLTLAGSEPGPPGIGTVPSIETIEVMHHATAAAKVQRLIRRWYV